MFLRSAIIIISLFIAAGCSQEKSPAKTSVDKKKQLLIGLIPEQNIFKQLERYDHMANYLSDKTGTRITLKILPRYGNIIDNFNSNRLDGAFFVSFTYALAHSRLGVEVVARPENLNGVSTYHGVIFVRKDSGIRSLQGMKGKRFALVDKATTAGYLLPMEYLRTNGVEDPKAYLKELYFAGTHEDAIYDVLNRKADIGAAKNTVFDRLAAVDVRIKNTLTVLVKSPDVPENALALRADLEGELKEKIRKVILSMHQDPAGREVLIRFGASRFVETFERDYEVVYRYAREAGIDLAAYEYRNE